jgi:hypothetical protein
MEFSRYLTVPGAVQADLVAAMLEKRVKAS